MKKFFQRYNLLIFILLLSLVPISWTNRDAIIAGGDDFIFLNPASFFKFSTWDSSAHLANFNMQITRLFPFGFFWWLSQKVGLTNPIIQKLWLVSMWFLAGVSIAYLAKTFFPSRYKIISFFTVPFYLFNPFTVFLNIALATSYLHTFLPLILAFFVKGIKEPSPKKKRFYLIYFGFATLLAAPAFSNPAAGPIIIILPFLYLLFSLFSSNISQAAGKILFSLKAVVIFILFNCYWLWVLPYGVISRGGDKMVSSLGGRFFATTSIFDIFRTLGGWAFAQDPWKVYERIFYENFWILLSSYLLIVICFISLFYLKKNKGILFFLIATAVSIFLIKGNLPPWPEIFSYLYEKISLLKGYREPWNKFTPLLIVNLSILFGFGCGKITGHLLKFKSKVYFIGFNLLIISMLFSVGYSGIFGLNIWDYNLPFSKSQKTKVPHYWYEMVDWFNHQDQQGIVYITPRNLSSRNYNWESGISSRMPLEFLFLKNPIRYSYCIDHFGFPDWENFLAYFGDFYAMQSNNFLNYLNMLGIKYIIQENDIVWNIQDSGVYSPYLMRDLLSDKKYLKRIKQFGEIDIYQVSREFYRPIIYPSNKIVLIDGPSYGFSSWNQEEAKNFSLINKADFNSGLGEQFALAHQIILKKTPPERNEEGETFHFIIPEEGQYELFINIWDKGNIETFNLTYQINQNSEKKKSIIIRRNPLLEKDLQRSGHKEMLRTIPIGKENLSRGDYDLKLQSPVFQNPDSGSLNYVSLNKYFNPSDPAPNLPNIKIKQVNSTKFILNVSQLNSQSTIDAAKKDEQSPYILNFAQNFDAGWKLYLLRDKKEYPTPAKHFVVNGVNNGWYINPQDITQDAKYQLVIEYTPQKILKYTLIISSTILSLSLIYILKLKWPKKNEYPKNRKINS